MSYFGVSRNIETSLLEYVNDALSYYSIEGTAVKSFKDSEILDTPFIVVQIGDGFHDKLELGDNSTIRTFPIIIDVYGKTKGNSLDLKDFMVEIIKDGFPYYLYMIAGGREVAKILDGMIFTTSAIRERNLNLNRDVSQLHDKEKFRLRLSVDCTLLKAEASKYVPIQGSAMDRIYISKIAGENLSAYNVVGMLSDEKLYKANYDDFDLAHVIGLSKSNYLLGASAEVIVFGEVENLSWSWTEINKPVYLGLDGALTQSIPAVGVGNYVVKVGLCTGDTTILIKPELDVVAI